MWLPNWAIQRVLLARRKPASQWACSDQDRKHAPPAATACPPSDPVAPTFLVLYEQSPRKKWIVAHCSAEAAALGIAPGQPLAEAQALAQSQSPHHASQALFEPHEKRADRDALQKLAENCSDLSPRTALADECSDAFWLDVSGIAHLFGGETALLHAIHRRLQSLGCTAHVAMADGFAAAWALARYRGAPQAPLHAPEGSVDQATASLPVQALQLSPRITQTLENLGLSSVELVRETSRPSLAARLGAEVGLQLDRLSSQAVTPLQTVAPPELWRESHRFEGPVEDSQAITATAEHLLERLCSRLRNQGLGALRVELRMYTVEHKLHSVGLAFFRSSAAIHHWLSIFHTHLERTRLLSGVEHLEAEALSVVPLKTRQLSLFEAEDAADSRGDGVVALIDQLTSRLGERAVLRAELSPDPHPERAYQARPLVEWRGLKRRRVFHRDLATLPPRPLLLAPRHNGWLPVLVNEDAVPCTFVWQGRTFTACRVWGPEKIETGWWRKRRLSGSYFRVEVQEGGQAWLAQDASTGRWCLYGWFD